MVGIPHLRAFGRLASRSLGRERTRRRLRRLDAALVPAEPGGAAGPIVPVAFPAVAPWGSRILPARPVPLRSVAEHREALTSRITEALVRGAVPHLLDTAVGDGRTEVSVRDQDWGRALTVLEHLDPPVLLAEAAAGRAPDSIAVHRRAPRPEALGWGTLRVLDPAYTGTGSRIEARYGLETAVGVLRWAPDPEEPTVLRPPSFHPRTDRLAPKSFPVPGDPEGAEVPAEPAELVAALRGPTLFEVTFPIDVVYTWVDGTDPAWLERKRTRIEESTGEGMTEAAAEDLRFVDHDELRYSLRSLERYAPWIRRIHLVTDGQRPEWLVPDHPRISVVDHRDIAPDPSSLPTFNSHAIEANLHRIEGLSEHFLYFNDDVFLSSPVTPDLFFSPNGIAHMYLSKAQVAPGLPQDGEPASDTAGKNARTLVDEVVGRRVSRKLFHAPFALRRSVSEEIEQRWPEVVRDTRAAPFRRTSDVTLSGALHMNYAFATGRAVTRGLRYRYVNVGAVDAAERLAGLEKDRDVLQTFCLNEANPVLEPAETDRLVRDFLRRRFPDRSTFELPG